MNALPLFLFCSMISMTCCAQSGNNIPVTDGSVGTDIVNERIVVKEPKVHFSSAKPEAYSVCNGIVRAVTNFNVVIESDGLIVIYQDVKGDPALMGKDVKRGDAIGTMYYNDEKKAYNLYISVLKGPKQYLPYAEVLKFIRG